MDRFVDKNGYRFDVGSWVLAPDQEDAVVVTGVDFQGEEPLVFIGGIHDGCWISPRECVVWNNAPTTNADSVGDEE